MLVVESPTLRTNTVAKYGAKASEKVEKAMHERKRGTLKAAQAGR